MSNIGREAHGRLKIDEKWATEKKRAVSVQEGMEDYVLIDCGGDILDMLSLYFITLNSIIMPLLFSIFPPQKHKVVSAFVTDVIHVTSNLKTEKL